MAIVGLSESVKLLRAVSVNNSAKTSAGGGREKEKQTFINKVTQGKKTQCLQAETRGGVRWGGVKVQGVIPPQQYGSHN